MFGIKYKSRLFVLKFGKTKVVIILTVLAVILIYDCVFYSPLLPAVKETSQNSLIPGMHHKTMVNQASTTTILLTVFYEVLCPDSRSFLVNHLLPSVQKAPKLISVDMVPYGKAKTEVVKPGVYKFTCQHGEIECFGNKIHACLILQVHDTLLQVKVLTCMISDSINPKETGHKCCQKYDIPWSPVIECAMGKQGDLLLKQHGDKTNALYPAVTFIPTILINNNRGNQAAILKNLWKEICLTLEESSRPKECENI